MRKKLIISGISLTTIISLGLLVNSTFCNPTTETNYLIQNTQYTSPANTAFVDDNFYKCVVDTYNEKNQTNLDYSVNLSDEQLQTITRLECSDNSISNTSGLEKLISLTYLRLDNNNISEINISANINLKTLLLWDNQLTKLDLSKNTLLEDVQAHNNELLEIDVSKNTKLTKLFLDENMLSEINLINNINLTNLSIDENKLTNLDITNNTLLTKLEATDNELTSIDISKNVNLVELYLNNNQLSNIDVSKNTSLTHLNLTGNELSELDLSNNNLLRFLSVEENNLFELDLTEKPELVSLYADSNNLSYINVMNNTKLKNLDIGLNKISSLDVSYNKELISLVCTDNELNFIDISENVKLTDLFLGYNKLTEIDLSNNTELKQVNLHYNELKHLDLSNNSNISFITLEGNEFSHNIAIYLNSKEFNGLELGSTNVIAPSGKSISYINLITDTVPNGIIPVENPGKYTVQAQYKLDFQSFNNKFTEDYNVYVIEARSEKYLINEEEGYIYTGIDINRETILNNISLNYGEASIEENRLLIKYEDEIVKEFDIVNVSSNKYDLTNEYIYVGTDKLYLENINLLNGTSVIEDNKLKIKYNDIVLQEYLLISNSSELYKFIDNNIYIGSNVLNIEKIDVINGTKEIQENKLLIKYKEYLLNEYLIKSINFGTLKLTKLYIVITEDLTYEEFISNITLSEGLTYKIFNGETEITEGNINEGMILKVYYNDEIIDTYEITKEYLDLSLVKVDEDKELIKDLVLGTTVSEFKEKISTSGNVTIVDKNNNELTDDKLITSGSKVKIELTSDTYEYTLSVKGDVTGTGTSTVSDVAKLYQYLKKKIDMEDCYKEAGNVVSTDNEIKINDVAKLYQFIKKKISSLED